MPNLALSQPPIPSFLFLFATPSSAQALSLGITPPRSTGEIIYGARGQTGSTVCQAKALCLYYLFAPGHLLSTQLPLAQWSGRIFWPHPVALRGYFGSELRNHSGHTTIWDDHRGPYGMPGIVTPTTNSLQHQPWGQCTVVPPSWKQSENRDKKAELNWQRKKQWKHVLSVPASSFQTTKLQEKQKNRPKLERQSKGLSRGFVYG